MAPPCRVDGRIKSGHDKGYLVWTSAVGHRKRSPRMGDLEEGGDVEVAFEMLGQGVERRLDARFVGERWIAGAAEAGKKSAAEAVGGEEAVEIAAGDAPVFAARSPGPSVVETKHRPCRRRPR